MSAAWYKSPFVTCGYALHSSTTSSSTKGGPVTEVFDFVSPTTPSLNVQLTFEQSTSGDPLLLYYAWAISQPARAAASLVSGTVKYMDVAYVLPGGKLKWKVRLPNILNLTAITEAVNALTEDLGVRTCFGSLQYATLRFTSSGKNTTYRVVPGCYDVYVNSKLRLLDVNHAAWNAVRAAVDEYCLRHGCKKVNV